MRVSNGNGVEGNPTILPAFFFDYLPWREEFAKALDPTFYHIQYVDSLVWSGRARLFINERAAMLVEIRVYPTGAKDAHGLLAAGDLEAIIELIPEAEEWGRSMDCIGGVIESRPGWQKVMKQYGYEPHQVSVRKEL